MLLIPIGFGMLIGNIPFNMEAGLQVGIYEQGSVLNILYQGVTSGLVSAAHLPRHRCHDRLLGTDFQSEADAYRGGSPIRYLRCLHDCP